MWLDADLIAALSTRDPEGQVDIILCHLLHRCGASGGAVVAIRSEDAPKLHVYLSRSLTPARVADLDRLWTRHRRQLLVGQQVATDTELLAPLHQDGTLFGFLLLDAPSGGVDPQGLELICKGLAAGLNAVRTHTPLAVALSVADLQKLELIELMEQHRGNKVAVAKSLGLSRRSVYLRLDRFGIPRVKRVSGG